MKMNKSGYIQVPGGKVWYKAVGKKTKRVSFIVVHGGPGYPHDYLDSIKELSNERQVIFYDQLGCGKSRHSNNAKLWTVKRYVRELDQIIKTLGLKEYYVLGHSWGAALAVSFALQKPKGLKGLILADPYLSTPVWERDMRRLIKTLSPKTQKIIAQYKKDENITEQYKNAKREFYKNFVWRYKKRPLSVTKSNQGFNYDLYRFMWGPEEFRVTGTLRNFDLSPKLSRIKVPTLLLCGRFDEATPKAIRYFGGLIGQADIKIFEKSAHHPHITETLSYMRTLRLFLQNIDA